MANIGQHTLITPDVEIGEGSKVWHFCNLYGCKIGKNTQIGSYCEIKKEVVIGDNCRFQAHIFVPERTKIGNNVFVGPRVTFLNDKHPTAKKTIAGTYETNPVIIEDEVSIGGGAIILPGVKIGKNAIVGGGAVVTKDIPPYSVVIGNPARVVGDVRDKKYEKFGVTE